MTTEHVYSPRRTLRRRLTLALREADWRAGKHGRTRRLQELIAERPWWDYGHPLMALTGRDFCGNWEPPRGRDLYLRIGPARDQDHQPIPGTATQRVETTDAITAWDGVQRGEEWKTFDWQDDGYTLVVGWLGDDGRIRPSDLGSFPGEVSRFRHWLLWDSWVKAEWLGLRRRLYYRGLRAAVDRKIPGTCQALPVPGAGGWSHWHCQVRVSLLSRLRGRRAQHPGVHRYANHTWTGTGAVQHQPTPARAGAAAATGDEAP